MYGWSLILAINLLPNRVSPFPGARIAETDKVHNQTKGKQETVPNCPSHLTVQKVPDRLVGEIELGAIQEGRHLSNFKYACAGYSIYLDDKDNPPGKGEKRAQLPICVGVELLADRAPTKQAPAQAPAHLRKEAPQAHANKAGQTQAHANKVGQTRAHAKKPGQKGDDFLTKFQRNAGLVASGVARNMNRVGTYVKGTVDDILYPYRKRPK